MKPETKPEVNDVEYDFRDSDKITTIGLPDYNVKYIALLDPLMSKKQPLDVDDVSDEAGPSRKYTKVHPFFTKSAAPSDFQWLPSLGSTKSCLHATNLSPKSTAKIAAFDLDGTIIKSSFPATDPSWQWWRSFVPSKLRGVLDAGYTIVIISNQALKSKALATWKIKIAAIAKALPDVPFRLFAATEKDNYRKPMIGMWTELEQIMSDEGLKIDKSASFFVGDAAGREYEGNKRDFASTDRKWAINVGLAFFTPEEYFLKLPPHKNFSLPGFHVSSLPSELPLITPTSTPLIPSNSQQEIVIFIGYPCLGKTSFYVRFFKPHGYVHINQDILKTRDKCVKAAEKCLKEGKSVVIDNTNRNVATRKYYLEIAKILKISARCFIFAGSIELAWHNNLFRAYNLPSTMAAKEERRALVPYSGFTGFRENYEVPQLSEGFIEIKTVNWVFRGTEEEKRRWSMWLQIDGR